MGLLSPIIWGDFIKIHKSFVKYHRIPPEHQKTPKDFVKFCKTGWKFFYCLNLDPWWKFIYTWQRWCKGLSLNSHPFHHSALKCSALTIGATAASLASLCLVKLISFVYSVVIKLHVVFNSLNFFWSLMKIYLCLAQVVQRPGFKFTSFLSFHFEVQCSNNWGYHCKPLFIKLISFVYGVVIKLQVVLKKKFQFLSNFDAQWKFIYPPQSVQRPGFESTSFSSFHFKVQCSNNWGFCRKPLFS